MIKLRFVRQNAFVINSAIFFYIHRQYNSILQSFFFFTFDKQSVYSNDKHIVLS